MKNQRSSTLSSPYDSYMYSQDSIEMNSAQINNYKLDDSPFQKLRGFSQNPQNRNNIDPNSILNTSPFAEGNSLVGIPITYLNLSNNSSQANNIQGDNKKQLQEAQQKFIQGQFAQSQILLPKSKQVLKDYKSINRNDQYSNINKIEDSGSPTDKNSGFDTGTFGGSAREDTFNLQISHRANSQDVSKSHNNQSYESPYSKNISTEYKTNQSFINENQVSIDKSKLSSTHLSYFSPSPLKQPKQSMLFNEQDKQQQHSIDYKLSSPYKDKIYSKQTEKYQVNQDLQSKDYSNVSKQINLVQNENIIIPKVQSSQPAKQNQSINYALNNTSQISEQNNSFAIQNNSIANLLNQNTQKNNLNSQSKYQINKQKYIGDNYNQYNNQNPTTNNILQKQNQFKEVKQQQNIQDSNFDQKASQISNQIDQNQSQQNLSQLVFKKQFTFQKQQTLDSNESKDFNQQNQNVNLNQQPQKIQVSLSKFSNNNQEFNPTAMLTNISEHFTTNQSAVTPQKQQYEIPQNSMNEFYEQMFQQNEEQGNQYNTNKQKNSNLQIYIDNEEEKYEESKKHTSNQRIHSQSDDFKQSSGLLIFDKLNTNLKEQEKQNQDNQFDILKLQSERDNLKEFIKNLETRNNLLNERIQLLEANLSSLNSQNMENIEKIVSLNKQLSEQDSNFQKKEKLTKNEQNQQQKDLIEATQRQSVLQSEIQKLIQRDLEQEKKILELTNKLNTQQQLRNDYEKAVKEQEILVKNNQNSIQIIEAQKVEIQKLQNLLSTKGQQEFPQSNQQQEKYEEDKKKLENECQKLMERNKVLEEHLSTMKISCQKLEQAMAANCNSTKGWLEKYNKLEKSYLNLQNQFRVEQQKQIMEKNFASKKDLMSNRSQQSFNRFRSELSEQEIKIQFQRNQELIRSEVQNERDELDHQNQQLIQKIAEIQNQNSQLEQQVQNLIQNNKKQFEENEIQKKDLISKLNIMINENSKLIDAYNERPMLIQKIQQLSQQNLEQFKQFGDNSTPFITQFSNIESSGLSLQPPSQFNSPQEEIKWYRLKCNQLEVKLKVKSEECAELIYQNKSLKKQGRGNNLEELTIKSSLYQTFQQSPNSNLIKQPGKFHSEMVLNANKQNTIQEEKDNRGFCEKLCQNKKESSSNNNINNNDHDINSETGRESLACNVKCL
ncbi:hypothetical protein TTHERM_00189240 (macronuclear) [Tetrahymena thermophila SB210]|uniref:Uncharacterized protein n=1 Tax=Tetrahymena thermophila (strain SB210) TaxID=312017 RepID=I7MJH6_TETTS|nr:hypothetical protein TTHERM_00189240 [Tetrahymena thermophila SB210]EAR96355.2 hypothetical protein TTHERM_00189240 [Tetrahymena thermophila SB210]|eukprot:XP_001016600.2 hypothetical protein TTHERM_00189240 [Tetrahymena thermophila SB210]